MKQKFQIMQYLPLTRPRACQYFLNKLSRNGVHCALDLEDSAQDPFDLEKTKTLKKEARRGLLQISDTFEELLPTKIYIRVNSIDTEYFEEDIDAVIQSINNGMPITGIILPKVEHYKNVETVHKIFVSNNVDVEIVPIIETSNGYNNLSQVLDSDKDTNLISKVQYGHFDYCLDSNLWPFPDPNHIEFWDIIKPMIEVISNHGKVYLHTPFPFPNNSELFWSSTIYLSNLMPKLDFWATTLNHDLSLSEFPENPSDLKPSFLIKDHERLIEKARNISDSYYEGRANKRSFGVSSTRFIPPHQVFAAMKFLESIDK
jgi:citrate lyase beta subunit